MQENVRSLLSDSNKFDQIFEEIFPKFDKNRNGTIAMYEYKAFIDAMFTASGKEPMSWPNIDFSFKCADKDEDGIISKDEFKNELKDRLRQCLRKFK